jgi:hypothetical protein
MKFINKYIAVATFGAVSLASCNDTLDVESPSQMDDQMVYSTVENATNALNGIYVLFCEDPFTSRMSNVWMQNTDVEASAPSAGLPGNDRRAVWSLQGPAITGFNDVYVAWNNCLQAIDRANQVIQGVDNSDIGSDAEMQQIKGEAVCLKAYRYLLMCNFWGDVPYYDKAAVWGEEIDKPRTDRNIIYSRVLQQLVDIEPSMKFSDANVGGIERMNRDFAMGLIARIALFRAGYGKTADGQVKRADEYLDVNGNADLSVTYTDNSGNQVTARTCNDYYQMAKNYCQKLISMKGRTLGDFKTAFDNEMAYTVVNNAEVLYEVAFVESRGGDVGWCIGVANTGSCSNGTTTAQVGLTPTYYMSFADNDLRRDITCAKYSHANDTIAINRANAIGVGKWDRALAAKSLGKESSKGTGINWPLMRYSDVLLMLAEAENELNGPTAIAREALTQVRARAFKGSPTYDADVTAYVNGLTGYDDFFKAIVNERAWEFGGEGLRRFDLIRWNLYAEKLETTMRQMLCWGISTNVDLMNLPEVQSQYPDAADYLGWADKLYYKKTVAKTNKIIDVEFLNDKYRLADAGESAGYWSVNWGSDLLKNVRTYEYQGVSYPECKKETVEDSEGNVTIKYVLGVAPVTKEFTINEGDESGVTRVTTYYASDYATRLYRGYSDGALTSPTKSVPYLLPICITTLNSSSVLSNDGYGLNDSMMGEGNNVIVGVINQENY